MTPSIKIRTRFFDMVSSVDHIKNACRYDGKDISINAAWHRITKDVLMDIFAPFGEDNAKRLAYRWAFRVTRHGIRDWDLMDKSLRKSIKRLNKRAHKGTL